MDPVNALICAAAIAWTAQIGLGLLQINRFNQALAVLSNDGHVRIGRSAGRFKPRVILAMSVSDDGRVTGNFVMMGLTVFARPYTETALCNKVLSEIQPEVIFSANKSLCEALSLAISNKR
ncbi:transcriptional regulator GutM [Pantoea agglomerans]|uniref:transcriptional regulator GutM n=2 Tax=Erwiniaceae TaxID=1903409 RepID=UPI0016545FF5|nr:transcriptional regulator GutM [Pantoea agglomerans]